MHALLSDHGGILIARHNVIRIAAFHCINSVGFSLSPGLTEGIHCPRLYFFSGLNYTACILATPGFVHLVTEIARGFVTDLLATL